MDLLSTLTQTLGGDTIGQLAGAIGADKGATQKGVVAALPLILGALNKNTNSADGAQALDRALERDHDGSVLDQVGGLLGGQLNTKAADGAGILSHLFGGRQGMVEGLIAQATGLDKQQAGGLLAKLAPIVLGALGQMKQREGLDAAGLSGVLGQASTKAKVAAPNDVLGMLAPFLDGGGGDLTSEVLKKGSGVLGKFLGGK